MPARFGAGAVNRVTRGISTSSSSRSTVASSISWRAVDEDGDVLDILVHFLVNTLGYSRRFHFWCATIAAGNTHVADPAQIWGLTRPAGVAASCQHLCRDPPSPTSAREQKKGSGICHRDIVWVCIYAAASRTRSRRT